MGKWVAGIIAAIISGVAIAYFSALVVPGRNDAPSPQPKSEPSPQPAPSRQLVGYIVPGSGITQPSQLTSNDAVCATPADLRIAQTVTEFEQTKFVALSAGDLFTAFQTGVCTVVFFQQRSDAQSLFPGITPVRVTTY